MHLNIWNAFVQYLRMQLAFLSTCGDLQNEYFSTSSLASVMGKLLFSEREEICDSRVFSSDKALDSESREQMKPEIITFHNSTKVALILQAKCVLLQLEPKRQALAYGWSYHNFFS
ncbi:hypothetical protein AVEN_74605-1 [Araneus ventricosus]|uniref:Uncharacterized protein n=2 Tax=Araneus ventricosus TaxID=182803 RepID=A0A4Y2QND9_ARAVE|nr:hypothetical protein AVEN_74605-1 [Araneus ventricosus]